MKGKDCVKVKPTVILYSLFLFLFTMTSVYPEDNNTIKVGMTSALSGPVKTIGISVRVGVETYFDKINAAGGIQGRKLQLIVLDDKYEPELAGHNMRHLVDVDKVLAVIGSVGTPTAILTTPIANEKKILLFGAFTGADSLRKTPPDRYVINFRASYKEEVASMIQYLKSIGIKPDEIAFFTQNDAYGDAGYQGAMEVLKKSGYAHPELLPSGRYVRNTVNVEAGYAKILEEVTKPIKAFIIVGTYQPSAKFIELARHEFPNALFLNVSFVGATALTDELHDDSHNLIITQVVPYFNTDLKAVREFREDIKKYFPDVRPGFVSFEGYIMAKLFVIALQKAAAENKLTREGIIDVFESMRNVDIGIEVPISFDRNHHQALHVVWPMTIKNGQSEPIEKKGISIPQDWSVF